MDGDVLVFAQVMTVIVMSTAGFVAIGLGARMFWRVGSRMKARALPPADDSRLDRLEAAVDAIAIEVERISESQRFTVSMLNERLPARGVDRVAELSGPGGMKRINTPH